jgi:hypothetical protein
MKEGVYLKNYLPAHRSHHSPSSIYTHEHDQPRHSSRSPTSLHIYKITTTSHLQLLFAMGAAGGGYSPRFQRQSSCSCGPSLSRRGFVRAGFDIDDDDFDFDDDYIYPSSSAAAGGYYKADSSSSAAYYGHARPSARDRLRGLWRRIVREKKRILLCSTGCVPAAALHREPYDAYSYAQNFDEGTAWVEPENLSRSFSARFAVPSRVLQRVAV